LMWARADMMALPELARDSRGPAPCASGDAATLSTNSLTTSSDVELLQRVGRGEAAAYRVFADRHLERTLRFAARLLGDSVEAEDAVQDAFMRVWTDAARFVPDARPSTWLFRIVHNQCIDRLRKRRPADPDAVDRQSAGDRPSGLLSRKQTAEQVARALAALPERQRAAITLVHYEGMGNVEAAEVLGVGVEAVELLLARGRRGLRQALAGLDVERGGSE
jgi:RNA polymerase sigma-70 factor (ECF subfamily)